MLGIPELDHLICLQLNRSDLARCARVNKKWNKVVVPYLWYDIKWAWYLSRGAAFRRIVFDDYMNEQRKQQEQKVKHSMKQTPQQLLSLPPPALAKYGRWIRHVPEPMYLLSCFQSPDDSSQTHQALVKQGNGPTAHELLFHLYQRCPTIQVEYLQLTNENLESDDVLKTVAEVIAPLVRHLYIGRSYNGRGLESWRLKHLLNRCSGMLKRLVLEVEILDVDNRNAAQGILEKERERSGSTMLPSELKLSYSRGESVSKEFWRWLWRRCSQVKTLDVGNAGGVIVQSLGEGMLTHMPSLDKIRLGQDAKDAIDLTDNEIATLLSGCRKGWKVVEAKNTVRFRGAAMEALATHFGTLEELAVYGCSGFKGIHLARVLSFSPRLRSLAAIDDECYLRSTYPHFDADTFIDKNPKTGSLNTWACETSLRVLKVKITGIPRPDVNSDGVDERYPGEGRIIQRQVYDRLARLTNLETLWLGHHPFFMDERYSDERRYQFDCLEMSLESGLDKLSGLKELKELNVMGMRTRIGPEEVQWMTQQWPKLHVISGLDNWRNNNKAVIWLREHHPEIEVKEPWR